MAHYALEYWKKDETTAWILEEIGKVEPITFGVEIKDNQIQDIRVLEFREIRGWEVRYPAFRKQFEGASYRWNEVRSRGRWHIRSYAVGMGYDIHC